MGTDRYAHFQKSLRLKRLSSVRGIAETSMRSNLSERMHNCGPENVATSLTVHF